MQHQTIKKGENTGSLLSRREQLDALSILEYIVITEETRQSWATEVSRFKTEKEFRLKTDIVTGELRVWRLK